VWSELAKRALLAICLAAGNAGFAQESPPPRSDTPASEPHYDNTFSGPIVELESDRITVSRSILGKPAERKSFWIKSDTRVEGKLRVKVKVTVGFVSTDEGDVARLIVVRPAAQKN
jgi:hypothetical protein